MKKEVINIKLHNLSKVVNSDGVDDNTLVRATFLILELDTLSGNNQIITKEEGLKMASTMKLKPLTCQYVPTNNFQEPNDHFGGHGVYKENFRDGSGQFLATNSFAIGVAEEGCYVNTVTKEDGTTVDCLFCDYVLWSARYPNIVSLIEDIWNNSMELYSSCEYLYSEYQDVDNVRYPQNLIFDGHCILCSGENGSKAINPAFKMSKLISFNEQLNKAINEVLVCNSEKEGGEEEMKVDIEEKKDVVEEEVVNEEAVEGTEEVNDIDSEEVEVVAEDEKVEGEEEAEVVEVVNNEDEEKDDDESEEVEIKEVNEVSHDEIQEQLRAQISTAMGIDKYNVWVGGSYVYDTYFIFEIYEGDDYKYYKASYTRTGDVVTADLEGREEVKRKSVWVTAEENQKVINEKEELQTKYNEVSDKILALNSVVEELKPKAEKYDADIREKVVNEKMEYYKGKFVSLNATDKFEDKEVQELIVKSINEIEAKVQLNEILIDLVSTEGTVQSTEKAVKSVNEIVCKVENLLPSTGDSFEERYGL